MAIYADVKEMLFIEIEGFDLSNAQITGYGATCDFDVILNNGNPYTVYSDLAMEEAREIYKDCIEEISEVLGEDENIILHFPILPT